MAVIMQTLREIATAQTKKMPEMVDQLTEESPILATVKWQPTTHGLWNMAEEVTEIDGAGFVKMNDVLPSVDVATGLKKIDLQIMGGQLEVPEDKLNQLGGAAKYFATRQPRILKKAGNDTEKYLYYNVWREFCLANKAQVIDAKGTGTGLTSIVIMRHDSVGCTGLYDQSQFDQGTLLKVTPINGGNVYALSRKPYVGVLGKGVSYKGYFGWQIMDSRCVAAIVNIDLTHKPTETMLAEAIAKARGSSSNTNIICSPMTKVHFVDPLVKSGAMIMTPGDNKVSTVTSHFNEVPILTSYNLPDFAEAQAVI